MNVKKIVGGLLLLFVAVSVVFVVYREIGAKDGSSKKVEINKDAHPSMVVVYYFHGNMRCATCRRIEALTRQAVQEGFSDEVKDGTLKLVTVNVEEGGNRQYVKKYALSTRSVVVSKLKNGEEIKWKRLDKVWQLVRNKNRFVKYVQGEIQKMKSGES